MREQRTGATFISGAFDDKEVTQRAMGSDPPVAAPVEAELSRFGGLVWGS